MNSQIVTRFDPINLYLLNSNIQQAEKRELIVSECVEENFLTDQGNKFSFKDREYLIPLYNYYFPLMVIVASRQAEKSTYVGKRSLTEVLWTPGERLLYATALEEQLKVFVRSKINLQFDLQPSLKAQYFDNKQSVDNIHEKWMLNGSVYYFRPIGNSIESTRGVTARKIYFDETQSILSDNIPIVQEITQSYENSEYVFLGTPLTAQNIMWIRYSRSKQYEWIIKCRSCNTDNPPLGKEHIDPKKPYLFCIHCGKQIYPRDGRWVAQNPEGEYAGFRICRLMTPTCKWRTPAKDGVLDKYEDPEYPEFMFVNEVLGLPEGVGIQPISKEDLFKLCEDYDMIYPKDVDYPRTGYHTYATIDWAFNTKNGGVSYTIYAIWMLENNRMKLLYAKRQVGQYFSNPDSALKDMIEAFVRFNTILIMTDYGIGHKENIRLRSMLASERCMVKEIMYTGNDAVPSYNRDEDRYEVGRTESLDLTFSGFNRGRYMFRRQDQSEQYLNDILNVYTEFDPNMRKKKYDHAGIGPDDFLHLCNYARVMFTLMRH